MNVLQIVSFVLFFYVFGLGAILLTWYTVKSIKEFLEGGQEHRGWSRQSMRPPPEAENDNSVKLHISEGLIQVDRLPEEKTEK